MPAFVCGSSLLIVVRLESDEMPNRRRFAKCVTQSMAMCQSTAAEKERKLRGEIIDENRVQIYFSDYCMTSASSRGICEFLPVVALPAVTVH
jgi:hypothetical protein